MKVTAISDIHGWLPVIQPTELLLIAGDICPATNHTLPFQYEWLDTALRRWLDDVPADKVIAVAGNHDWIFYRNRYAVPTLKWTYLQDDVCEYKGLKIYGTPWQPPFFDWAFNASEEKLAEIYKLIPDDTDIIISHGPPYTYGDGVLSRQNNSVRYVGSKALLERIRQVKPRYVFCGHIHCAYGYYQCEDTEIYNVSYVDESYFPAHEYVVLEIETDDGDTDKSN